jgi:hypothetical protein
MSPSGSWDWPDEGDVSCWCDRGPIYLFPAVATLSHRSRLPDRVVVLGGLVAARLGRTAIGPPARPSVDRGGRTGWRGSC